MGEAPVVAHADVVFYPHQTRLECESPRFDNVKGVPEEAVRRPEMQVGVVGGEISDRFGPNRVQRHCRVVIYGGGTGRFVVV